MASLSIKPGTTPHGLVNDSSQARSTAYVIQCVSGHPLYYADAATVADALANFHVLKRLEDVEVQTPASGDIYVWSPNNADAVVTVTESF